MLILFDNGTPRGLARFLTGHSVEEARARGWEELTNGELIDVAEQAGFEVLVTTDKNIRYQQNLKARKIALVVLEHSQWPMVKLVAETSLQPSTRRNPALPGSRRTVQGMRAELRVNRRFGLRLIAFGVTAQNPHKIGQFAQVAQGVLNARLVHLAQKIQIEQVFPRFTAQRAGFDFRQAQVTHGERADTPE